MNRVIFMLVISFLFSARGDLISFEGLATDEDINNPEVFAKLDSSQMASVIAKELKYFTKQGGNRRFIANKITK